MAWGPDLLSVEVKSPDRAKQISSQLGQLGFHVIENKDDASAGILSLSKNPSNIQASERSRIASFDFSRRPRAEQFVPAFWALFVFISALPAGNDSRRYPSWLRLSLGVLLLLLFFWDATRIWGWRLELPSQGLRIRRRFRWTVIPWDQIHSAEVGSALGRNQEAVLLKLGARHSERLGTFGFVFARKLRDRLQVEIARHRGDSK